MDRPSSLWVLGLLLPVRVPPAAAQQLWCDQPSIVIAMNRCDAAGPSLTGAGPDCTRAFDDIWVDCQRRNRRMGEPFPRPTNEPGDLSNMVMELRRVYLRTGNDVEEVAAGNGVRFGPPSTTAPGPGDSTGEPAPAARGPNDSTLPPPAAPPATVAAPVEANRGLVAAANEAGIRGMGTDFRQLLTDAARLREASAGSAQVATQQALTRLMSLLDAGSLYGLAGDDRNAIRLATRVLDARPQEPEALRLRAQARLRQGDGPGALEDAALLARVAPGDAQARRLLGAARELAQGEARVKAMHVGFEERPDAPELPADAAASAAAKPDPTAGWPVAAVKLSPQAQAALATDPLLRSLAALAPRDLASRPLQERQYWTAVMEAVAGRRWKEALEPVSWLVENDKEQRPETLLLRAKISGALGNWRGAESDAKKALALAPEDPAALLELGYALFKQGKAAEGLALIERSLALRPTGLGEFYRAEVLEALGRKGEAVAAYRAALALDPVLRPLVEAALARLEPSAAPDEKGRRSPPWRRTLGLVAALIAALLALKGAHEYGLLGRREVSTRAATAFAAAEPAREAAREAAPGETIGGHFRVEKELARGGMGVVYLATDTVLQRPVAIKRLNADAYASEDARRKFVQEAQLAARLKHPNLASIHSVFGERELYLVFEYVEGESLDSVLVKRGRLGLREARGILSQVCAALAHAHQGRVIHRDLKPANVMLAPDGSCKILDFGIAHEARTLSRATQTQAWGTPPYMAPEQEDGYVSPASDLYSVGVMAYELLAGRRPFEGADQLGRKRSGSFAKLGGQHGLPPELDRFFLRALNPDPALRFSRAEDFSKALDELSGTPVRS